MNEQETRTLIDRLRFPSSEAELSAAAGEAADDREWFNQRLANSRLHNSSLEQRIARLRLSLKEIALGKMTKAEMQATAQRAVDADAQSS
jgi:hypothetical protein